MMLRHVAARPKLHSPGRARRTWRLSALAAALLASPTVNQAGQPTRSVAIPGDGGWDYAKVDEVGRRLYVAHGDSVAVVDLASGRVLPPLAPVSHAHAVVPLRTGDVAVTSGGDDSVRFFDRASGRQVASVPVGAKPDAAIIDPVTGHLLSIDADGGDVAEIDPVAHRVVRTIPVAKALEFAAIDGRTLFINNEDRNEIELVDLTRGVALAPISLPGCDAPTGLGLDAVHHRLISACANGVAAIVDIAQRRVTQRVPIGRGPDAVIVDASRSLAFIPAGKDGVVDVLSLRRAGGVARVRTIPTAIGARTGALDATTGILWFPVARLLPAAGHTRPSAVPGTFRVIAVDPSQSTPVKR